MDKEKVLDKVKKLLSLGRDGGATEAEQATALGMAARLLAENGLTEDQIDSSEFRVDRKNVVVGLGKWKGVLAMAAANLYGAFVTVDRQSASMNFYGPEEVIEATAMTYEWLIDQVNMMRDAAVMSDRNISGSAWGNNFKTAASNRIHARVNDILKSQVTGTGNALVLHTNHLQLRSKEIMEAKWGAKVKPGKSYQVAVRSLDAWDAGHRAGDAVQINKLI